MKYFLISALIFFSIMSNKCTTPDVTGKLLVNHVGYLPGGVKKVIFQTKSNLTPDKFEVKDLEGNVAYAGKFVDGGQVDQWHTGNAFEGNFTELKAQGKYVIAIKVSGKEIKSLPFTIQDNVVADQCISLLLEGMQHVRCEGEYDEKDKSMSFFGEREDTVDVHGGWYDASGEKGKYLSHLCFTNYMAPQQTPMFVWNMMETVKRMNIQDKKLDKDIKDEIAFGADFLVRMQDKEGYFYLTIFANWSWEVQQREISAYAGQHGEKNDQYKAGFREGAGIAIAALARASTIISNGNSVSKIT